MKNYRNNPWIAALLNFFLPGLGYVYLGKKLLFSILLLCGIIVYVCWIISLPDMQLVIGNIWLNASLFFLMFGFAVDAYTETKRKK